MNDLFSKLVNTLIATIAFLIVGSVVFFIIGYSTQHATLAQKVNGLEIRDSFEQVCETPMPGQINRTCLTTKKSSYVVYGDTETFSTSGEIYYQLVSGKRYSFYVIGWPGFRMITRIVEVGK